VKKIVLLEICNAIPVNDVVTIMMNLDEGMAIENEVEAVDAIAPVLRTDAAIAIVIVAVEETVIHHPEETTVEGKCNTDGVVSITLFNRVTSIS